MILNSPQKYLTSSHFDYGLSKNFLAAIKKSKPTAHFCTSHTTINIFANTS